MRIWHWVGITLGALAFASCGSDESAANLATENVTTGTTGLCAEDERVQGGACVACPPGTTNRAGDAPSGGDTRCD